ncbi:hypothetical protein [Candidatus Endomicrobiellum agilis]|uniref:hypothetical protein n=1 Tax=Candidatus Endomicrobiellum agilis TaxID=3238957 RepID=UPI00357A164A|nr:hypothetical protein [Endomicrobium sp.]
MKRNIVILLCLVFFTQSAFAMFGNDCRRKRRTYKQERNTCYQNNDRCQKQLRNESSQIEELTTQKDTCLREKASSEERSLYIQALGFGASFVIVLGCIWRIVAQNAQIAAQDARIVAQNAQIAAHQPIHNVAIHDVANANINIQN